MLTIAVCGNHKAVYCTEAEVSWTLESMGHRVVRLQENEVRTEQMLQACQRNQVQLFMYTHTHGFSTPGEMGLDRLIYELRRSGINTASFHLDRFWGLAGRESRIGEHPLWLTDRVFTADGGHQEGFAAKGVNHTWMPPGIALRHCFRGQYRPEFACNVAFVGTKGYHAEYPFRMQLIAWLEQMYGQNFRRFGGDCPGGVVREERLNDLYASVKVVVGDSCFAGNAPYYWSDRVPETLGRGGFLIHPRVEGLDIPGLVTYTPGCLDDLQRKIDEFVRDDAARWDLSTRAMECVKACHTYTNRMQTLLTSMGLS